MQKIIKEKKPEMTPREKQKLFRTLLIPLTVVVLIFIIVIADFVKNGKNKAGAPDQTSAPETMAAQEETTVEETASEPAETETRASEKVYPGLSKEVIPEIHELMVQYCDARAHNNADELYALYGRTDVDAATKEQMRAKMQYNSRYIDGFQSIVCYTVPGLDENSWLVYTTAEIHFRTAESTAPTVMWCYVTKNEAGSYEIVDPETFSDEISSFVHKMSVSEGARTLASDTNARLANAIVNDTGLSQIYGTINAGSPLWTDGESQAEVMILDGTEAESTDASGAESDGVETDAAGAEADTAGAENGADAGAETTAAGETTAAAETGAAGDTTAGAEQSAAGTSAAQ